MPTKEELEKLFIAILKNDGTGVCEEVYAQMEPYLSKEVRRRVDATDGWFYISDD